MILQSSLTLTIRHQIPGRLRLILSHAPQDLNRLREDVSHHPGISKIEYTPITRSLLILYSPQTVTFQELLVRVATRLSLDYDSAPIKIQIAPSKRELNEAAYYSGIALLIALFFRFSNPSDPKSVYLNWGAATATGWAVLDHGWTEYQERGNFDPELVSIAYLINSMIRGTILPAACLTWAAAFGRHLLWPKNESVELRPVLISQENADSPQYELVIKQSDESKDKMRMLGYILRSTFGAFFTTPAEQQESLLDQIHEISNSHGKVLEGLSDLKVGIPVHIR